MRSLLARIFTVPVLASSTASLLLLTVFLSVLLIKQDELGNPRWGDWATWVGAVITAMLLVVQVVVIAYERRRANRAELATSLAIAGRVSGWLQPTLWRVDRQGLVKTFPAGWQVAFVNGMDAVLTQWWLVARSMDTQSVLVAASHVSHGAVPPGARLLFEVPPLEDDPESAHTCSVDPPQHYELAATLVLSFTDRAGGAWFRGPTGHVEPRVSFQIPPEVTAAPEASRLYPGREIHRQGIAYWQVDSAYI